jgi:hypothetical protein
MLDHAKYLALTLVSDLLCLLAVALGADWDEAADLDPEGW